ncbi:MAG: XdhC family protein [Gammaproteobacteria bacterium]|nr:XdhC family protein [Gammaproteobacteria bacterium]
MESIDEEILNRAVQWLDEEKKVFLVTALETWDSAFRPAGSLAVISEDGHLAGSVSGGCIEEELAERLTGNIEKYNFPVRFSMEVEHSKAQRFGLSCGGRIELLVESITAGTDLYTIHEAMLERKLIARSLDLNTGQIVCAPASVETKVFEWGDNRLTRIFGPSWQLVLIGAGQLTRILAQMAKVLDYRVVVCDPRPDYAGAWKVPGTELIIGMMPEELIRHSAHDARSAVIALTHDFRLDDAALMLALDSPAFYVGALDSQSDALKRREHLSSLGLSESALARLHGSAGLAIGARTPAETAISILAELTAVRHSENKNP